MTQIDPMLAQDKDTCTCCYEGIVYYDGDPDLPMGTCTICNGTGEKQDSEVKPK